MADKRLRVLVVSLGRRGGINDYGWLMTQALSARCAVAAVTSNGAENRERWATLGAPHLEVPTFSTLAGMLASFFAVPRFVRIMRFAREFAPDVVYYPGGHAYKPVLDLLLPRRARIILTVHDPELHAGEDSILHRALAASNRLRVHGYVLLNEAQRAGFIARHRLDPARVDIIPHGAFDHLSAASRPLGAVDGLEAVVPFTGTYALFAGRIERYKGVEILLTAYQSLPAREAFPLVIAGSGEFSQRETELLRALEDRPVVVLNRWLSDVEVASLVAAARFVVLPYTSATQSGVIPLASAFGTPAIASDAGGIAEQVLPGETGLSFPTGDSDALALALEQAFHMDDDAYARMREACRAYAEENWSWDVLAERVMAFAKTLSP